jgi:hypothetical protein
MFPKNYSRFLNKFFIKNNPIRAEPNNQIERGKGACGNFGGLGLGG